MAGILKKDLARDYSLTLSWRFAEVEFLGLPKLKDEPAHRLEHIYVPLRLCRDWKDRFQEDKTFHVPQILQQHQRLVVLGDPGSGKSTLVKVLTYAFGEAKDNAYKRACGQLIPIPIILRLYNTRKWRSYRDMLRDFVATLDEDIRDTITPQWLVDYLRAGRAILMIDGVDEVGSRADREHLRDEVILPLLKDAPLAWTFVTSRVVGYDEVPFEFKISGEERRSIIEGGLECLYVAPFNNDEIRQFVTRWYALRETLPDRQQEGIESLMRALNQNDRVKRLANNPQLLTLIALVHRVTANLPSGRVELYDKIVEAYLETIQVFRKLGTPARLDEMKRWLANVGWRMQTRRDDFAGSNKGDVTTPQGDELLVSRAEIKTWLVEAIQKERGTEEAPVAAERFLDYVARRSGLLVPRGPDEFSFVHLTFQEYFAAFALRGRVRNFDQLSHDCTRLVEKRHWHETLNLLFEMLTEFPGACDDLFNAILNRSNSSDTAAEFISLLLPDEQSGLSFESQTRAAEFVLQRVCETGSEAILNNLRQLGPTFRDNWIEGPLIEKLRTAPPSTIPAQFFAVGDQLVNDWRKLVCDVIKERKCEDWTEEEVFSLALTCRGDEAAKWASERLILPYWVSPINEIQVTLVEELLSVLLNTNQPSARLLFLAQAGLISTLFSVQLLRLALIRWTSGRVPSSNLNKLAARRMTDSLFVGPEKHKISFPPIVADKWTLIRFFLLNDQRFDSDILKFLWNQVVIRNQDIPWLDLSDDAFKPKESRLINFGLSIASTIIDPQAQKADETIEWANQALFAPDDDWTRLIITYYLITVGVGTSVRCSEMNELLDSAICKPESFTFPKELESLAHSNKFIAEEFPKTVGLLFWHQLRKPVLSPKWFDSRRKESEFFRISPASLLKAATEMIDKAE